MGAYTEVMVRRIWCLVSACGLGQGKEMAVYLLKYRRDCASLDAVDSIRVQAVLGDVEVERGEGDIGEVVQGVDDCEESKRC